MRNQVFGLDIKNTACIGVLVLGVVVPFIFYPRSPSYLNFTGRDQLYYAQIAEACDILLAENSIPPRFITSHEKTLPRPIKGVQPPPILIMDDGKKLPLAIKALQPTGVLVSSNSVLIWIGPWTRPGYGISWHRSDFDRSSWELTANGDGSRRRVFLEHKLP